MALVQSHGMAVGTPAPDFSLPGVDGRTWSLSDFSDAKALVVVFTCNHCPYAIASEDRLVALQRDYESEGVRLVAINPNDARSHPGDSFERMVAAIKFFREHARPESEMDDDSLEAEEGADDGSATQE